MSRYLSKSVDPLFYLSSFQTQTLPYRNVKERLCFCIVIGIRMPLIFFALLLLWGLLHMRSGTIVSITDVCS